MKLFKRITSFLTACAMMMGVGNVLSYGGRNVWAVDSEDVKAVDDESDEVYSGKCGDDVYWELSDGVLEIYGTGEMSNFEMRYIPWSNQSDLIHKTIIHEGVSSIGTYAFFYCTSLSSITIPDSVSSIAVSAFLGTPWLEEQRKKSPLVVVNNILVDARTSEGNVIIPDSVSLIEDSAFSNCTSLSSITIPNSVSSIGDYAFYGCTSLASITIPDSVSSIGGSAFNETPWLKEQRKKSPLVVINNILIDAQTCKGNITIPNSVSLIGNDAFYDCDSLLSVNIPDSVFSIGDSAFYDCDSLSSITIPESVSSIGDHTFFDCTSLTSVTIPESVSSIGSTAFNRCTSLTSITIPDSVSSIGDGAFSQCASLTSITIPDSVSSIGDHTFYGCTSLASITIPENISSIGDYAFECCDILKNIYYAGTEEQWSKIHIGKGYDNSYLASATIHYNYKPTDQFVFPYTNPDNYVADCLNKGIIDPETGKASANGPVVYQSALSHDYTYERLAKALLEDESLLDISNLWTFWNSACNGDFKDLSETQLYEVLIMDYLAYESQSSQYKSDFEAKCAKYGWEIYTGMLDEAIDNFEYLTIPEVLANVDLDVVMQACKDKGYAEKIKKYTELAEGLNDVALTSYDYYQKLSQALAIQETDENRIKFLNAIKESASNNKYMCDAIDNIIKNLEASYAEISFSLGAETMLNFGVSKAWELITDVVPVFKGFEIGVTGFDWLFNSNDTAVNNTKLILLYTLDQYARQALIKANINYTSDPTRKNAMTLNDSFESFLTYQEYATNWSRTFISDITFEGMFNIIQNIFSDNRQKIYDEYIAMFDEDVEFCEREVNYLSEWRNIYNKIANVKDKEYNYRWCLKPSVEAEDIIVYNLEEEGYDHSIFNDLAYIKQNGKYGIIDYEGEFLADCTTEGYLTTAPYIGKLSAGGLILGSGNGDFTKYDYSGGIGLGDVNRYYSMIDENVYICTSLDDSGEFYRIDSQENYSENELNTVRIAEFRAINNSRYELIEESKGINWGISKGNKLIVDCEYEAAIVPLFLSYNKNIKSGNVSAIRKNGKWCYVDSNGNKITDFIYNGIEGAMPAKIGYSDQESKPHPYLATEGLIAVKTDKGAGFIDINGKEVIPVGIFEEVRPVHNNLAWVKDKDSGLWGVIEMVKSDEDNLKNETEKIKSHIDFYETNKTNFINPNNETFMTDLRDEALYDGSVDTYETLVALKKALEGDFSGVEWNEKLATETVLTEILSSEEFVNSLSNNMQEDVSYYTDAIIDYIGIQASTLDITGDSLKELQKLIKESGNTAKKQEWIKKYFKSIDVDGVGFILGAVGVGYNIFSEIAVAHDDIGNYLDYISYLNANETAKKALVILGENIQKEKTKAEKAIKEIAYKYEWLFISDIEKMPVNEIATIIQSAYATPEDMNSPLFYRIETEDMKLIDLHYRTISIANEFSSYNFDAIKPISIDEYVDTLRSDTFIQSYSYIATFAINIIIGKLCPQVSLILGGLGITLTVGINLWEEISKKLGCSISDRALERDLYLNLLIYHNAITNAMTCEDGFGEKLKDEQTLESLELFEEGFSMYKKIRILCLKHGAKYSGIRLVATNDFFDKWGDQVLFDYINALMTANIAKTTTFSCHESETSSSIGLTDKFDLVVVACPVDVTIYNGNNIAVESNENTVTIHEENSPAQIDIIKLNEEQEHTSKICIVPDGYELKITGYDDGKMQFKKITTQNGSVSSYSVVNNIPVKAGSTYTEVIEENKTIAMECDLDNNGTADETVKAQRDPEGAYGDVNGDGVVTAIDMSELILILTGKKTEYDKDSADTDSDSLITISDLVKLRMYILEQSIA